MCIRDRYLTCRKQSWTCQIAVQYKYHRQFWGDLRSSHNVTLLVCRPIEHLYHTHQDLWRNSGPCLLYTSHSVLGLFSGSLGPRAVFGFGRLSVRAQVGRRPRPSEQHEYICIFHKYYQNISHIYTHTHTNK